MAVISGIAWLVRGWMHDVVESHPALPVAGVIAASVWLVVGSLVLLSADAGRARAWRHRVEGELGIGATVRPRRLRVWWRRRSDPLEWAAGPLLRTAWGSRLADEWRRSGLGRKGSRYLLALAALILAAGYLGGTVGGPILAIAMSLAAPILPISWVRGRAQERDRQVNEQVPAALDGIAAGLSAGLSFDRAVMFAGEEQAGPMNQVLARLHRLLLMGHPFEIAIERWQREYPLASLELAMEGVKLQRQLGGDMIRMLSETAELVRTRLELEREVHAVTAQGRLSGWVIAGLVPVSAAVLLSSNPRYIDVLFDSLIGQVLLAIAIGLQLLGWSMISRLIQIDV